jgi:starch synthase
VQGDKMSEHLHQLIENCSKDKKCEINNNSEEKDQVFESYFNIYTELAG